MKVILSKRELKEVVKFLKENPDDVQKFLLQEIAEFLNNKDSAILSELTLDSDQVTKIKSLIQ